MSSIQPQASAVPVPDSTLPSPGARLRQAREQRGESVGEVAFALKLSPRQIAALESDDFAALPGMAFVRGFLRNYARYLGLDPAPLLDDVQRLAGEGAVDLSPIRNADGELPSGSGPHVRAAPIGWVVLALVLMVLAGWYFDWFRTEPPAAESELDVPVMGSVAVEPEPAAAVVQQAEAPQAAAVPEPGVASGEPPVAASDAVVPPPVSGADVAPAPAAAETPPAPAGEALAEVPAAPAGGGVLAFRFAGESWVEVRDAGGAIIYSGTNRAGSTRSVQGRPPFALVIGNAAGVSLEFDGRPVDLAAHTKVTVARLTVK